MRTLRAFGRFWYDFVVGDDWRIAAGVVAALGVGAVLVRAGSLSDTAITLLGLAAIVIGLVVSLIMARRAVRAD
jgi:hypothetical protein